MWRILVVVAVISGENVFGQLKDVSVTVSSTIIERDFMGIGFNLILAHDPNVTNPGSTFYDEVYGKRLREVRPGFVRMNPAINYRTQANRTVLKVLRELEQIGTSVYFTSFSPPYINITNNPQGLQSWAADVAHTLTAYLMAAPNAVKFYCWTNEFSLCLPWDCNWGSLIREKRFDIWGAYYRAVHTALDSIESTFLSGGRGLLATDASPINYWWTMDWALGNVDNITAIYGAHHYPNNFTAEDRSFYPWWLSEVRKRANKTKRVSGKRFVVGETAGPQYTNTHKNVSKYNCAKYDGCAWFDSPDEPFGALQLIEQAIGVMNGGGAALAWWTFFSEHFIPGTDYKSCNDWGASKWNGTDTRPRMHYEAVSQVSRAFSGPASSLEVTSSDPSIRASCVAKRSSNTIQSSNGVEQAPNFRAWSCVLVNRNDEPVNVSLALPVQLTSLGSSVRIFATSTARISHVAPNVFGDLEPPKSIRLSASGLLTTTVSPGSIVYTTDFSTALPSTVMGLSKTNNSEWFNVTWQANPVADKIAYYRVYVRCPSDGFSQIRSTINTVVAFQRSGANLALCNIDVAVCAVNIWGNVADCP